MDKTAIEKIQETAHIPEWLAQLDVTEAPVAALPESLRLHDLECYMEHASRYRLKYQTDSLADFVGYNKNHDKEGAACFIDATEMKAESIFDLGTPEEPGHKSSRAILTLKSTAAFRAVKCIDGHKLSQKEAGEFIEDWSDYITVSSHNGEDMPVIAAVKALQDLTIESAREVTSKVSDLGASMTAMERIEAKNKELFPSNIIFACKPYAGLSMYSINIRVGILTGDDKPKIVFRIVGLESLLEEMAEEFKDLVVEQTKDLKLKTFIGSV